MSEENAPAEADTAAPEATAAEETWRSSLPEDIRENPTLGKYDSIEKLAAAHINLQSHLGRDKISKPVTEDDWNDVYNFLGRPEDATEYELAFPDNIPNEVKSAFDEGTMNAFREKAHSLGMNQQQVSELFGWYAKLQGQGMSQMADQQAASLEEGEAALREKWGRAYDQNVDFAKKAFEKYGGDDLAQIMDTSGLGNHPAVLEAFAQIAKATMPDKELIGPTNGGQTALTPEEARLEAQKIMANPAYTNRRHPEHAGLVKQVQRLFERAHGDAA